MTNYVIVGAGAAGLYTAYRLLNGGTLNAGDTVRLFEWSDRPGGRICTYTFPASVYPPGTSPNGLYCEFGGMRFATDANFPNPAKIVEGHVLVQQTIIALNLQGKVVPFQESTNRMYYLRGRNVYETTITSLGGLPYNFNSEFGQFVTNNKVPTPYTADNLLGAIAGLFAPGLGSANAQRSAWCSYYANGTVTSGAATPSFPANTPVRDMGYWNLLYDQFGDEGFDYTADGTGYTSNVINWNSADAMQANNDYGSTSQYMRLDGGYSILFEALANQITALAANYPGSGIFYNQRLVSLEESKTDNTTTCNFVRHGGRESSFSTEHADVLFLAMPRRALEMIAEESPAYMLNTSAMKYFLESSIDQPAIKAVLVFDQAWWTSPSCTYPPNLVAPYNAPPNTPTSQWVGGATITDLPLRMVYYFANNIPCGPGAKGGPYVMLASYDDMNYSGFWREVELSGDYSTAPSQIRQPLTGPTSVPVDSAFAGLLLKQLAEVHGIAAENVPAPTAVYYQDWGQDPFGGGYHGWASHYNICQVMDSIRAPYQKILNNSARQTYIIGSCYSFDQAWVEGALCVAESVLQDFVGLPPLNPHIGNYTLICKV
ncbi:MAG TPA: FAD-dependent oxidoreductase [Xanthobacteraceae bacterium]|nr:FAD-dependent oxidoreductase [Xanthobacteraceae bacterium]